MQRGNSYKRTRIFTAATAALLSLFLLFVLATALHHHSDNELHPNCSICVAGSHVTPACFVSNPLEILHVVSTVDRPQQPLFSHSIRLSHITGRAPPA